MRIEYGEIGPSDLGLLDVMLHQAIFVPKGEAAVPRSAMNLPEIARYGSSSTAPKPKPSRPGFSASVC